MANEISKTPTQAQPQMIPLSKIHELPGVFNPKPQDKSLGSMVLSIESSGVKEPVILRQEQLPNITPHSLRHTFCTRMANAGMNPKALQYIMGHANITMTLDYHSQSIYVPLTKNHHTPPVPADAKIVLAPLPAQEQFSHPDALYVGVVCLPPHRWQIFFPQMGKPAG